MQIIFLYKCFIISCACLQHTDPLQQQKVQQQRPCQPQKTHTNLYACTQTHYSLVHRKFCIKHILAGCPGQGVPNMPAAVWLCHWYKTRLLCVCTSAVRQHTTPCASVRKWNSCNPNQISSSQPQRALKLLKVPDVHLHLLSFQDRIKSYSYLQGRREGGEFAPPEQQQQLRPCTHLCGCVALQVR